MSLRFVRVGSDAHAGTECFAGLQVWMVWIGHRSLPRRPPAPSGQVRHRHFVLSTTDGWTGYAPTDGPAPVIAERILETAQSTVSAARR
jgi:hypothetical protein